MAELTDLFKLAPVPWGHECTNGPGCCHDMKRVYDARGIWLADVREESLATLIKTAPMMAEELEELERWFRGINSVQLITVDQAQRWAKVISELLHVATGGAT